MRKDAVVDVRIGHPEVPRANWWLTRVPARGDDPRTRAGEAAIGRRTLRAARETEERDAWCTCHTVDDTHDASCLLADPGGWTAHVEYSWVSTLRPLGPPGEDDAEREEAADRAEGPYGAFATRVWTNCDEAFDASEQLQHARSNRLRKGGGTEARAAQNFYVGCGSLPAWAGRGDTDE